MTPRQVGPRVVADRAEGSTRGTRSRSARLLDRLHFQEIWSESTDAQLALVELVFEWFSNNLVLPVSRPPRALRGARARFLAHAAARAERARVFL